MEERKNELVLIPKSEAYIQYMIEVIIKLPRTEKYSIGTEYKESMYKMLENILMLSKVNSNMKINYINHIDAQLNTQRILLRIMQKNKWIDNKKFDYVIGLIYELGKIIGGLLKFYGKDFKKRI